MKRNNNHGHRLRWSRNGKYLTAKCQLCGENAGSGKECVNRLNVFEVK
jgi:hypothetical protein